MKGVQHWRGPCDLKGPLFRTLGTSFHTVRGNHRLPFRFFFYTPTRSYHLTKSSFHDTHTHTHSSQRYFCVICNPRVGVCVCVCVFSCLQSPSLLLFPVSRWPPFQFNWSENRKKKPETKKKYIKETFHLLSTHDAHW